MEEQPDVFNPLSTVEWDQLLPNLENSKDSFVTLVLIDGSSIVGIPVDEDSILESGALALALPFSTDWKQVTIPRGLIAGGEIWGMTPPEVSSATRPLPPINYSASDGILHDLVEEHGLSAVRRPIHAMSLDQKVEVREIYPGQTILCADWPALARHRRFQGSVSVGFTVYGVGISTKWEQSIERFVRRRLGGDVWDWSTELSSGQETVIEAHPVLLLRNRSFITLEQSPLEGDEGEWVLILLRRLGVPEYASRSVWETGVVAAVRNRDLGLPLRHWETVAPPLRFLGKVVKAQIETELGKKSWYLQVIAAGVDEE